jgi:hypothetical protein
VSACSHSLSNGETTLLNVVEALGPALKHGEAAKRLAGLDFLVKTVASTTSGVIGGDELDFLVTFFIDRLKDRALMFPSVLRGLHAVVVGHADAVTDESVRRAVLALTNDVSVQSFTAGDRGKAYNIFAFALGHRLTTLAQPAAFGERFLLGFLGAIEGETNAKNLHTIFSCWPVVITRLPVTAVLDDVFDALACYYPIDFRGSQDGVTRAVLAKRLRECLLATPAFAPLALPLFIEKLDSEVVSAKVEALTCLQEAALSGAFSVSSLGSHMSAVWASCKQEIMGIRETTSKKVVKEALATLAAWTDLFCRRDTMRQHVQRWLSLLWDDLAPFLRFLESSLCETAVDILATVAKAGDTSFADNLTEKAVASLLQMHHKAESDKVLLGELTAKLLLAHPKDYSGQGRFSWTVELCQVCLNETGNEERVRQRAWTNALIAASKRGLPAADVAVAKLFGDAVQGRAKLCADDIATLATQAMTTADGIKDVEIFCQRLVDRGAQALAESEESSVLVALSSKEDAHFLKDNVVALAASFADRPTSSAVALFDRLVSTNAEVSDWLCSVPGFVPAVLVTKETPPATKLLTHIGSGLTNIEIVNATIEALREAVIGEKLPSKVNVRHCSTLLCSCPANLLLATPEENLTAVFEWPCIEPLMLLRGSLLNKMPTNHGVHKAHKTSMENNANKSYFSYVLRGLLARGVPANQEMDLFVSNLSDLPKSEVVAEVTNIFDEHRQLSVATHHKVLPFYRQRFFQRSLPKLVEKHKQCGGEDDRSLTAIASQLKFVPPAAARDLVAPLVPLFAISVQASGGGEAAAALLAFFRHLDPSAAAELAVELVPLLAGLAKRPELDVNERVAALEALESAAAASGRVPPELRRLATESMLPLLDDSKRLVRTAAAEARNAWLMV